MIKNKVVSREQWLEHRRSLLKKEKELTRLRDELTQARQQHPFVLVDKSYRFTGPDGVYSLSELFGQHSQLIVQHFMFGADWEQGCPSCSFWADNFNGTEGHLAARDIAFVAVSNAPLERLQQYATRLGWRFPWYSAEDTSFGQDYHVTFDDNAKAKSQIDYNYTTQNWYTEELPGVSVFLKDGDAVYHTYSTYSRGLDNLNGAYHYIDLTPKGRNEDSGMSWVRRNDEYG
jgi:predicted dithiol-disulfide oxidoreductase (DUF899 family)